VYRILEEFEDLQIVVHAHLDQHAAVFHLAGPCTTPHVRRVRRDVRDPGRHFDV